MATRRSSKRTIEKATGKAGSKGSKTKASAKTSRRGKGADKPDAFANISGEPSPLHEVTQSRYLNYALSVITSRALPDVRDGLKPVQRRILYTMWQQKLSAEAKHRKCAKVVGDVMGNYHPHGDSAIYDALVRLAQPFSVRLPTVDGSGNFGSLDGDAAAAMRYTECRLAPSAAPLLEELNQDTVSFRPNYDGTKEEPVVLPAKYPNLLINGGTGIAVGMATNIPPHNPEEVCQASISLLDALVEDRELSSRELARTVKGPDFPTGAQIVSSPEEIKKIYETGQGSIKIRAAHEMGEPTRTGPVIVITSIPYAVNKATLVERIANLVTSKKMQLIHDVRDVSADDIRIEIDLKKDADPQKVLGYLYKHTPLQTNFAVNMTCLVPTENAEIGRPDRLDLHSILWHFLHFRLEVVTRRLEHELQALQKRIHILEGFEAVFDALDAILAIIRKSEGKADAAKKIIAKYDLDAVQTDAILELKLYRLARLEIMVIRKELREKRKRERAIKKLLGEKSGMGRWQMVRSELEEVVSAVRMAGGKRRTKIASVGDEPEFSAEDLIVEEDAHVLVTTDGWIKRQREIKDPMNTRVREGDSVLSCFAGSTRATAVFFSNLGTAYTLRIADIPATTGYGEPIQKNFKLKDGERVIAAFSLDKRLVGDLSEVEGYFPESFGFAASSDGMAATFGLATIGEVSTKSGRRYFKLNAGQEIVSVDIVGGEETIIAATTNRRVLLCPVEEVSYLASAGKGVHLIKLEKGDRLLAAKPALSPTDTLTLKTSMGGEQRVNTAKYETTSRAGKGREIIKRGKLAALIPEPIEAPEPLEG
ncbi:MAG: DNA topoisomerase IV subunit A [Polyangiaceae bacterium]|nr:DNA topoisomerase IV subunit A [Polyangiaceae bacterium]